jgi:filamentous hemagglutinin family protein
VGKVVAKRRVRGFALASVSLLSLVVMSAAAGAQPLGGSVVAGQAQISASGATTLINQSSAKAIINWQSFSVGQGSAVQFNQPNSSAITLNRVTGASASTIDGAIRANGQVWLLNPNGLLFGNGATINVGGLLATTSDIANQDFLSGRYNFTSTGGKGAITNAGSITAGNGGSVVLSAPSVANTGLIQAQAGHVVLGGTDTFTVDFTGDHLLSYAIGPTSSGGKLTNSGKLAAAGGTVLLTARAASGVQDAVINNSGMVQATSVRQENGEIILEADNGTVANSGTLDASGKGVGETGGTVKVLGQQVQVADGAKIDVSGDAAGGTALIGGNLHGAGPQPNAQTTTVGKATINASAITSGNGGTVAVYSTGTTTVSATITAQGGIISGKGGMVETSGHILDFAGTSVDAGQGGTWLLDPDDLTVDSTAAASIDSALNGGSSVLLQTTATSTSGPGNTNPAGNGDIFINAPITWASSSTLTLDAYHSITVNAPITISGAGRLNLYVNDGGSGGDYSFAPGSSVNYGSTNNGGSLFISSSGNGTNAVSYTLLYCMITAVCGNNVQGINGNLTGNYALATSLDATGVAGWVSLGTNGTGTIQNGGNGFAGAFEGLGNTISNLTVNGGASNYQGLFGYANLGTIRDIGLVGGSTTGGSWAGGLVGRTGASEVIGNSYATGTVGGINDIGGLAGESDGIITNSYATGAVTATGTSQYAGGLVGINSGAISTSFASGAVTNTGTGGVQGGGLAGSNSGTITNSYATGAVGGAGGGAGGLVGLNGGTINTSYATGAVTGPGAGGLIGFNPGTANSSYWDTDSSGNANGVGNSGSTAGITGLTTSQLSSALPTGFSASVWAHGGVNSKVTPYLPVNQAGFVLVGSDNLDSYTLIFTTSQLQAINNNLNGFYALGAPLDASAATNWVPLGVNASGVVQNGNAGFAGTFDGLGNTINNLNVNVVSAAYAGLFGYNSGTVKSVGVVGGSVTGLGATYAGGVVAYNTGIVNGVVATSPVNLSSSSGAWAGGLIGYSNAGNIIGSTALGSVTGGTNGYAGGLVGQVNGGTIGDAYAMGAVQGGSGTRAGGLVGLISGGSIIDAFSTGAVIAGAGNGGGLIGQNTGSAGNVTNGYWDVDTSGLTTDNSPSGTTGLHTAALQGTLPTGFSATVWGTGANRYPEFLYLGNPPPIITGTVTDVLGNPVGSSAAKGIVTVSSLVNAVGSTSATAGANGVYYLELPPGTFTGTNQLLTYVNNSTNNSGVVANNYFQNITTSQFNAFLTNTRLQLFTPSTSLSGAITGLNTAQGSNPGTDMLYDAGFPSGSELFVQSSNAGGFSFDMPVNVGTTSSTVAVFAAGPITQTAGSSITANSLLGNTTGANANITFTDNGNDVVGGSFITSNGNVSLNNPGQASTTYITFSNINGNLTVNAPNSAIRFGEAGSALSLTGLVTFNAGNGISQGTSGLAAGGGLTATTASGGITLTDATNQIGGTVSLAANTGDINFTNSFSTTLGNVTTAGNISILSGGTLTLAPGALLSAGENITLDAGATVSQDSTSSITQLSSTTRFNVQVAAGDVTLNAPTNAINGILNIQAPGNISLTNNTETQVLSVGNGVLISDDMYPAAATSVSIQVLGAGHLLQVPGGFGITAGAISLATVNGIIGDLDASNPLILSGGADGSGNPDAATTSLSADSGGANIYIVSHSPLSIVGAGVSAGGGAIVLDSYGSVAVNAPITTSSTVISIDTGGSIQVNAPITDTVNALPGAIALAANDPIFNLSSALALPSNSNSNGITGAGLLTAGIINLDAGPGQNGLSGSIGTQAQPLQVTSDTGLLSLAAGTNDGNVYLNSAVGVSIDNNNATVFGYGVFLGEGSPAPATGIITAGSNALYGQVSLTAAGPITQTFSIQSGNLTLTSTGANGAITLTDTGCISACDSVDPGNSVYGTVGFNSGGNVTFDNSSGISSLPTALNVGASNVSGALTLNSASTAINISDPADGTVHAGSISLTAGAAGGISISSPLVSDTSIVMFSGLYISQNTSASSDAHIQAGTTLFAQASSAALTLADLGNGAGDPGNQIAGQVVLQGRTVVFANVPGITFGTDAIDDPSTPYSTALTTFTAITPGNITIAPGASISASSFGPAGIVALSLQAGGNFINNSGLGQATLVVGNTSYFNIYSANPVNDVFGGLDSGNTAVWDTAAGASITAQANRYIFAFQPTLTVNIGTVSKPYGTDDSATLQGLASSPTGLEAAVKGAFQGDTAASVFSGTPSITSAGSAAGAGVGTYSIIANLSVTDGYAVTASGSLTVTPQTLFYTAGTVSRTYGSANPTFGGSVTGFVNGDTQSSATSGTLAFAGTATAASGAGSYAITGSGLSAVNYVFAQSPANATALIVTPATLTYTANVASRAVGAADPVYTGSVSGYVNGDTQTSATTGTLVFSTSATSTSPAGSYAIDGSGLNAANYTFVQAAGNATALTITGSPTAPPPIQLQSFTTSIQPPPPQDLTTTPLGATPLSVLALPVVLPPPLPPLPSTPPPVDSPLADLSDTPIPSDQITSLVASSLGGASPGDISSITTGGEVTTNGGQVGSTPSTDNSDQTSSGDSSSDESNGGVVIPKMLTTALPPLPPPTDISNLSSFGNSSLWQ